MFSNGGLSLCFFPCTTEELNAILFCLCSFVVLNTEKRSQMLLIKNPSQRGTYSSQRGTFWTEVSFWTKRSRNHNREWTCSVSSNPDFSRLLDVYWPPRQLYRTPSNAARWGAVSTTYDTFTSFTPRSSKMLKPRLVSLGQHLQCLDFAPLE